MVTRIRRERAQVGSTHAQRYDIVFEKRLLLGEALSVIGAELRELRARTGELAERAYAVVARSVLSQVELAEDESADRRFRRRSQLSSRAAIHRASRPPSSTASRKVST